MPEPFLIVWTILLVVLLFSWFRTLREMLQRKFHGRYEKLLSMLVIIFVPFLGTLLYFSTGRQDRLTDNQV